MPNKQQSTHRRVLQRKKAKNLDMTPLLETGVSLAIAKRRIDEEITVQREQLLNLSRTIHANPELSWEEHQAAGLIAETMREAGFRTTLGAYGVETAVEAVYGDGDFTVAVCAEYDALPGIGHGCGHNVIAAAGVGAALALAKVANDAGLRIKLLGTPAEEHGGGKVPMLREGAWEDVDISLMVHGMTDDPRLGEASHSAAAMRSTAVDRFQVVYTGRTAHAAAVPEQGINASNASILALNAFAMLRQHLPQEVNLNAFISEGGEATNIIPERSAVQVELRAYDLDSWRDMKQRVLKCFEAGAVATGCEWTWEATENPYAPMVHEPTLCALWDNSLGEIGRKVVDIGHLGGGSTDMGNVSQVVPSIHPMITFKGQAAPPHNPEFTAAAASPAADDAVIDGAAALARTAAEAAMTPEIRHQFQHLRAERPAGSTQQVFEA